MPASSERIPVEATHKRLILVVCFAFIVMEHQAGILFLWPLDHSCARPANLTIFTELFTDSKSQPIDLDAVQRNLFDATPEDSFTMARAASMGIEYDDVARCFEYSVDYQDDNQPVFNMDILEPCRFGLRFELLSSRMSIIDHYNLACRRQWLKIFVPQSFALGLLSGLLLTYFVRFGASRKLVTRRSINETLRPRQVKLIPWTGLNLTTFVALYLVTLILNQCYLNNSLRATPLAGLESANELAHREQSYFLFVASIFLRSALVGSVLCRVMMKWRVTSKDVNNFKSARDGFHRQCFISFAIALVVLKLGFIPLAMKLFASWSSLSIFLTLSQVLLLTTIKVFELLKARPRCQIMIARPPQSRPPSLSTHFGTNQRDQPKDGQLVDDNEPLDDGPQPCNLGVGLGGGFPMLFDMDEMTNSTTSAWASRWRTKTQNQGFVEASFKACEFCSAPDEHIFGIMSQSGGQRTTRTKRDELKGGLADESSKVVGGNNFGAYLPTTEPLDRLAHVTAASPIEMRISRAIGSSCCADTKSPMNAGGSGLRSSSNDDSRPNTQSNSPRRTSSQVNCELPPTGMLRHNSSLFEWNVTRWPLMSKLSLLAFCLTFNYFLMQTIPNHKLQHGESISSLMDRKTSHRIAQFESGDAHENSSRGLAPTGGGSGDSLGDPVEINGRTDELKTGESVHQPGLISGEQKRANAGEGPISRSSGSISTPRQDVKSNLSESTQQRNQKIRPNESSPIVDARDTGELLAKIDPPQHESASISAIMRVGPEYAISNCSECAAESSSRDKKLQHANGNHNGTKITTTTTTTTTTTVNNNKTIQAELLKSNESAINRADANISPTPRTTISFNQIDLAPSSDLVSIGHERYKYDMERTGEGLANHSSGQLDAGGGSHPEDLLKMNISRTFNYNSVDYASQTFDRLVRSWSPLELAWLTAKLNGWPVELSIIMLYSVRLTSFEPTYFKLNRLFSLLVHGSKLLAAEWLLVALVPKQNHLLELDWLLGLLLLLGRSVSSLMLFSHLHMILKLAAKLDSRQLIRKSTFETIPVALVALALALWAPILERVSLLVTPLLMVASNLATFYLARSIEAQFKDLLCPMMFE